MAHDEDNTTETPTPRSGQAGNDRSSRVVWGRASSSNVQAVMWCLAELGLAVQRRDAGGRYGVVGTEAYRAMNPNGTVPTLIDGAEPPLWETGAILRYLANRYGSAPFWPEDLRARTDVDRWAEWARLNVALRFTVGVFWQVVRKPVERRDHAWVQAELERLEDKLEIAERRLSAHSWLTGDAFTLADIQFGHCLFRYYTIDIPRTPRPALDRYYRTLTERPAYHEHVMVSFDELRDTM